uniref:E3 ubiquitin-protein ligase MBR2 n=1 Tax=Erigeron canadensis TaxID=72917 RepID=UPI001CB99481|nr:E3 ubiquitin-protein ligase MBR2 [Erigeron canadensis]XP_043621162.1 E3 ubiquitin-protein ligase MBR2 [Erigeron canadensis]XP_043621163.1 E3 ubiquitin-protein ligase MBR2 [Erigeron canadensis]
MPGQRSIFDPFPEPVDLNQGSNSNSTSMDESDDWNILSPMERRLLNNDLSRELNISSVNTNNHHNLRSFSSWDVGESSSRASLQDRVSNDGLKPDHDSRLKEHRPKSSTISTHDSFPGGQVAAGSSSIHMNVNLDVGYEGPDGDDNGFHFMELYKSDRTESAASGSSHGIGPSECESGSSLGSWGLKRKALEGTSSQSLTGGSSSCFPESSRSLNISSSLVDPMPVNCQEPPNTQIGVVTSAPGVPENSQTHFGHRGWVPYNNITSTRNSTRHPNIDTSQRSSNRQLLLNEFLDQTSRGTDSGNISDQQPPLMHIPSMPRNTNHFWWGSNIRSRSGNSSSSPGLPLERSSEPNIRNHVQHHNFVPSSERNLVQDPTRWSLATGSVSTNGGGGAPPISRNVSGSGGFHPFNSLWTPQLNSTMPSQQGSTELPPWTLFPSAGVESGGQRGPFPLFPAGSSSTSEDGHISSRVPSQRHHYQPFPRSALLMEIPGDDWRALAADIEGRQRLVSEIRQVLNAMRRGENLRAEDYMLFDPFINGVAELHDRHRDLRLDVDNMSYEELLALEERIGDVNTGLSEEVILKSMKQKKHIAFMAFSTQHLEPCCICQEEYDTGDDIGSLDCGHDFHRDCIKQWLAQKNICPICKMTGLAP